jgi:hypothetical protein
MSQKTCISITINTPSSNICPNPYQLPKGIKNHHLQIHLVDSKQLTNSNLAISSKINLKISNKD